MKGTTLIVLLGPTGVGKTDLSIRLADTFQIPIINADSRQIFAEIPIGTAAPTAEQLARTKHYFVGNHRLTDYYSASMFEQDVLQLITPNTQHPPDEWRFDDVYRRRLQWNRRHSDRR